MGRATAYRLLAKALLLAVSKEGMPLDLPGSKKQARDAPRSGRAFRGLGRSSTGKNRRVYFDKHEQALVPGESSFRGLCVDSGIILLECQELVLPGSHI